MSSVFVSYRHDDNRLVAGRVAEHLTRHLGKVHVFRDPQIETGTRFSDALKEAIASAKVMVVVMGPQWEHLKNEKGEPKLFGQDDWVRREIVTALENKASLIPVLLERPALPAASSLPQDLLPLLEYQAHLITDRHWEHDVQALATTVAKLLGVPLLAQAPPPSTAERVRQVVASLAAWVLLSLTLLLTGTIDDPDATLIGLAVTCVLTAVFAGLTLLPNRPATSSPFATVLLGPGLWAGQRTTRTSLLVAGIACAATLAFVETRGAMDSVRIQCLSAERVEWKGLLGRTVEKQCPTQGAVNLTVWHPGGNSDRAVRSRLRCIGGSDVSVPPILDPKTGQSWVCAIHSPNRFGQAVRSGYVRFRVDDSESGERWLSVGTYRLSDRAAADVASGMQSIDEAWQAFCTTAAPLSIDVDRYPTNFVLRSPHRAPCDPFKAGETFRVTGQVGDPSIFVDAEERTWAGCSTSPLSFVTVNTDHEPTLKYGDRVKIQVREAPRGCEWLGVRESRLSCVDAGSVFVIEEPAPPKLLDYLQNGNQATLESTFHLGSATTERIVDGRPYAAAKDLLDRQIVEPGAYARIVAIMQDLKPPRETCPGDAS